jgi:hypothetical protein
MIPPTKPVTKDKSLKFAFGHPKLPPLGISTANTGALHQHIAIAIDTIKYCSNTARCADTAGATLI